MTNMTELKNELIDKCRGKHFDKYKPEILSYCVVEACESLKERVLYRNFDFTSDLIASFKRDLILSVMSVLDNQTNAAKILGVNRGTLGECFRKHFSDTYIAKMPGTDLYFGALLPVETVEGEKEYTWGDDFRRRLRV